MDIKSEIVTYSGETYYISYSLKSDSTINFEDSKSEENYNFLSSKLSDNPTASMFISIADSTTYLFDDNIQYKEFLDKITSRKKIKEGKVVVNHTIKKREDITDKFSKNLNDLDSGISINKFVYNNDNFIGSLPHIGGSLYLDNAIYCSNAVIRKIHR